MRSFLNLSATKQLQQLAQTPFDLQKLSPERLKTFRAEACDYTLLYGTERVNEEVMRALFALSEETQALTKMAQMQSGDRVNQIHGFPSEDRPALHTATRDLFKYAQSAKPAQEATQQASLEIKKLHRFLKEVNLENRFNHLIQIGIGGSDLGPRAHYEALQPWLMPGRKVSFIANIDPDDAANVFRNIDLSRTLILVVSKTGTTLETTTNEAIARKALIQARLNPREHFLSVTCPGSPLDNTELYRQCFYMWDWIGGRYSTTSMVGGVMLSFAFGLENFLQFLQGAHAMDQVALTAEPSQNLPLLAALLGIWNRNFLNHQTLAIIPYSQALHRYPAHLQQLDMESNGKRIDKEGSPVNFETGPIIWGEPGTCSQHSFFQLLHQGTTVVPVEFIGFHQSQFEKDFLINGTSSQQKLLSNLFAQSLALATGKTSDNPNQVFPGNRPSRILLGERLTPYSLGTLLAFYEHKVAFQGFIWNINSFDQEGVQLGKVLANRIIERFKDSEGKPYPLADAFIK